MREYRVLADDLGPHRVEAVAVRCGQDLSVTLGGGERYHVGAVALAVPKGDSDPAPGSQASVSVISVQGHRDDEAARWAARFLATSLNCVVTVAAGIHLDNATPRDIEVLMDHCRQVCGQLVAQLKP